MLQNLNGWHAVILLVIILLLFGAPKLPGLAKSLGQSMKIFKAEVKTPSADDQGGNADGTANGGSGNRTDSTTDAASADERTPGPPTQHKP